MNYRRENYIDKPYLFKHMLFTNQENKMPEVERECSGDNQIISKFVT